jgi:hypothetical protein
MKRVVVMFGVLALAIGCSRKAPPVGAVERGPLVARLCDALHAIPAQRAASCCATSETPSMAAECVRVLGASVEQGAVDLDAAGVEACVAASRRELEGCAWVTPGQPAPPKECLGVVHGKIAIGGTCRSDLDCAGTAHCLAGRCSPPEPTGASCGRDVDQLAALTRQNDLEKTHPTCAEHCSLLSHKCEPTPTVGSTCFSTAGCADGHTCVAGKCSAAPPGRDGDSCTGATCARGLSCVGKKCAPLADEGQACVSDFDCARGGCSVQGGRRVCGMTCSHAGELSTIASRLAVR